MALDPQLERPHVGEDPAFSDAVTCAFADETTGVQGSVRIGLSASGASGLVMLFAGGAPAIVQAEGSVEVDGPADDYAAVLAAGVEHRVIEPHRRWSLVVDAPDGRLEVELEAEGPPFVLEATHPAARRGGLQGYEQPCRVRGTLTLDPDDGPARTFRIDAAGQRGHQWGAPDWSTLELSRTITGWFGDGLAFTVSAMRPAGAHSHASEVGWAAISRPERPARTSGADDEEDEVADPTPAPPREPVAVEAPEPRISTTTDAHGHHTFATVELWESDEGPVWTATGEPVAGTTLELGAMRLDVSFFRWRLHGRTGIGRYDVLRRLDA